MLDSAHGAMPYYEYCRCENITSFIGLNGKGGRPPVYKDDFTIDSDGVPICKAGYRMRQNGIEKAKGRAKFKCPKMSRTGGCLTCTCDNPCSNAKYGRTVHLVMKEICGYLMIRHEAVKNGKRNIMPELRLNVPINVKK